jgi:hypothetical protein
MGRLLVDQFAPLVEKLRRLASLPRIRMLVIGGMLPAAVQRRSFSAGECDVVHVARVEEIDPSVAATADAFDLVLIGTANNADEEVRLWRLRERFPAALLAAWTWDNHHHYTQNLRVVLGAEIIFPSQWFHHGYLATSRTVVGPHLPLSTFQFTGAMLDPLFPQGLPVEDRSDALYGGFFAYPFASGRTSFVEQIRARIPGNEIVLRNDPAAFGAERIDLRLRKWCSYKVGLVIPINRHLSSRLLECLLTGQVPLAPRDLPDLDVVIPPALQEQLPVVRFDDGSVESVHAAYAEALAHYDRAGHDGVMLRHRYARENHELDARVRRVEQFVRRFKEVVVLEDDAGVRAYAVENS